MVARHGAYLIFNWTVSLQNNTILALLLLQMEIVLQFFTGSLDVSEIYCDSLPIIAAKYFSSVGGFWFDFLTSLPWSFNDLYAYQVTMCLSQVLNCITLVPNISLLFVKHCGGQFDKRGCPNKGENV